MPPLQLRLQHSGHMLIPVSLSFHDSHH
jgi:hypothetical protein